MRIFYQNIYSHVLDYDVTGNGTSSNTISLEGFLGTQLDVVVNTAATSGITIQPQIDIGGTWTNIGSAQVFGASLTAELYSFEFPTQYMQNATALRLVYSSASGTVRVDVIAHQFEAAQNPVTPDNTAVIFGATA